MAEWWTLRAVAVAAAQAGGRAALRHFRDAALAVERKADDSPVTRADREAEAAARAVLADARPGDAWLGEESGAAEALGDGAPTGRRWIIDPVDGTRNFVRGIPLWSTLVGCEEETPSGTRLIAAAAFFPAIGECYDAVRGGGARLDGAPIRVSAVATLPEALFAYYTHAWFAKHRLEDVFLHLSRTCSAARGGGDAWMHCMVACGRADVCVEPGLAAWDLAATSLIVEEAGGRCSDLDGRASIRSGNAVLSNGRLHDQVLDVVRARRGDR